jgi:uncharacterized protein YkwD
MLSRRMFMRTAGGSIGLVLCDRLALATSPSDLEKVFAEIRANLLVMVNEERVVEKVPPLAPDDLATEVANKHAIDLATREFASHWGSDGLKAYHRYSFAGGTHATQENVSSADNTWSTKPLDLKQDTAYLHVRLYNEKPPNDGHRRTILAPQHTHVGFGLAVEQLRLRMVELFVAKHVTVENLKREANPGSTITFSGKILNSDHLLNNIEVFYEPLPSPPELSWLRQPRSYSLPADSRTLRPRLLPPYTYPDRTTGIVQVWPSGSFTSPIKLYKSEPGIYTIVTWLRSFKSQKAFPATGVCIRAE